MFHLILEFMMCTFLLSFDEFRLLLEFHVMVPLHLLYSLFLVFLQVLELYVIMPLFGLKHVGQQVLSRLRTLVRFVAWLFFTKLLLTCIS